MSDLSSSSEELTEFLSKPAGIETARSVRRVQITAFMMVGDLLMILLGFSLAAMIHEGGHLDLFANGLLPIILPIYLVTASNKRAYGSGALAEAFRSVQQSVIAFMTTMLLAMGVIFCLKLGEDISRLAVSLAVLLSALFLILLRIATHRFVRVLMPFGMIRYVILRDGVAIAPGRGETCIDAVALGLWPQLDSPVMLHRIGHAVHRADRVLVACRAEDRLAWAKALKGAGVTAEMLIPELDALGVLSIGQHGGALTAVVAEGQLSVRDRLVKRAFDLAIVLFMLPMLLLVSAIVAGLVKLDDGGPLFFRQPRIGEGNRIFMLYKFRSMRQSALDHAGSLSTVRNDARLTRIGGFLRMTSLDELPQLINVLRGEMSIVGPRPHALASTAGNVLFWDLDSRYFSRHAAKPGLTGLAQVRGFRGATETAVDLTNRVQADLEYISGWTLWRDVKIVVATFRVLIHSKAF